VNTTQAALAKQRLRRLGRNIALKIGLWLLLIVMFGVIYAALSAQPK
jgi:hypothetical protein